MKNSSLVDLALLLNRVTLGGLFALAGLRKLIPAGGKSFIQQLTDFANQVAGMAPLPQPIGQAYGFALPFVELIAGTLLVLGLFVRINALILALLLLSFIVAMGINWWPAQGPPFDTNVILLTLALLLALVGGGKYSLDKIVRKKAA